MDGQTIIIITIYIYVNMNNNSYRYQLERYRGRSTRHVSPQCGRKYTFTKYIDTYNNIYISDNIYTNDNIYISMIE